VHVLPGVRSTLLRVLERRGARGLWLRDPADRLAATLRRGVSASKALLVRGFAAGFAAAA